MKHYILLFIFLLVLSCINKSYSQEVVESMFEKSWISEDYLEQVKLIKEIISISPESEYGLFYRAYNFTLRSDNFSAIELYTQAIHKNNIFWQAYYKRGILYFNISNYYMALADFNKVISLEQNYDRVYYDRGKTYYLLSRFAEAISDFDEAINLNDKFGYAYYYRGLSYENTENYANAIFDYTKSIELYPDLIDAYKRRALLYEKMNEFDNASKDYIRVSEIMDKRNLSGDNILRGREESSSSDDNPMLKIPVMLNYNDVVYSIKYPDSALYNNIEGTVKIRLLVGENGYVIEVGDLSGPPIFYDEVKRKVLSLKFIPAENKNGNIMCWVIVSFNFKINKSKDNN